MIVVESVVDIDRPATEVFSFVADQTNAPRWQHGLHEVRRLTDGPIGVGTEHAFVRRFAGRRIESRNRFIHYEPSCCVQFEIPDGWLTGQASYLVEPTGTGRCRLISSMQFHATGPAALAGPLLAHVLARDSRRDEAALKALLEAQEHP
ncbi:MAG: SRPBCC family protein [Actinomycetota bacterium]|nr:SRPBCC family protein [Actinomycetota bacterium]